MSIVFHARLQYVYWLVIFTVCGLLIKIGHAVVQGAEATTAAIVTTILCVSTIATYIDKKIFWGRWNIVHIAGDQWKCLQCGETFRNQIHFMREKHKITKICEIDVSSDTSKGCGEQISECNQEHHKQQYCVPCDTYYRICKEKHNPHNCKHTGEVSVNIGTCDREH